MIKRLTVHLTKVKKVGKDFINTISVHNLKSESDIKSALSTIRKDNTIAKCQSPNHKKWKVGDEMWYTSNETL